MPSNRLILCRPLLLPSIFPNIRVFSNESVLCIRWPKYWSFSFNISPSNEHPRLISFRMDWLDLLVVQGTLKSLLQHHSSKPSILQLSAFFIIHLSHSYMLLLSRVSHVRLCGPIDGNMPGLLIYHQLLELAQTHIHRVSHAIQSSHHLSSPSPSAFNLSQHQCLFN